MEYMTPNFTKDMVKTQKILIPNMAVTQFRLMQAALASEGYQTEVLGNCGSEVAQLGLKYVHNDTCYPALLGIGQAGFGNCIFRQFSEQFGTTGSFRQRLTEFSRQPGI